jgi:hypothetical protein
MTAQKFKTQLRKIGSWTIAPAPFDTMKVFGTRQYVKIKGTIDGYAFSGKSLMPFGDGKHFMTVPVEVQRQIGKRSGDTVSIYLERDHAEMEMPEELLEALEASDEAKKYFTSAAPSMRRNYARYIMQAKTKETREKRAVQMVLKMEREFLDKAQTSKNKK